VTATEKVRQDQVAIAECGDCHGGKVETFGYGQHQSLPAQEKTPSRGLCDVASEEEAEASQDDRLTVPVFAQKLCEPGLGMHHDRSDLEQHERVKEEQAEREQ